jgi:hypothetical protein
MRSIAIDYDKLHEGAVHRAKGKAADQPLDFMAIVEPEFPIKRSSGVLIITA